MEENDPKQDWCAVAIFPTRKEEPTHRAPYEDLLRSKRVKRVYLEDVVKAADPPVGLGLLQLLFATEKEAEKLAPRVVRKAETDFADGDLQARVVELVERALMARFTGLELEEIRMKFKLHDIRKSKAWQELRQEGVDEGREKGGAEKLRELIEQWTAKGMTEKQIAELLNITVADVRKLANGHTR